MSHIRGPLHTEVMGPEDAQPMVFVHPNPMDSASWIFQMARFSTWYRCIAVDLPGYGRSPSATAELTMDDVAEAVWAAVDRVTDRRPAVLVGCSVGSTVVQRMYHLRPAETEAAVLVGGGWRPIREFVPRRIADYREHGLEFRYGHTLYGLSEDFATTPLAHWFAALFTERNPTADLDTIITMFEALGVPDPDWLHADLHAPVLIVSGALDRGHDTAGALHARLPDSRLATIDGAGHACYMEQPWEFDRLVIRFLRELGHTRLPAHVPSPPEGGTAAGAG
jgi:pimeloyl-ACP methyl ester carboxylesterase